MANTACACLCQGCKGVKGLFLICNHPGNGGIAHFAGLDTLVKRVQSPILPCVVSIDTGLSKSLAGQRASA